MPTLYLYELSSFTTPPPNEGGGGGAAIGTPNFTITTGSTISVIAIEVTDNDNIISENGGNNQVLTNDTVINGITYLAGTQIRADYYLTDADGEVVISISVGGTNSGNDITQGIASTQALQPNTSYVFTEESNANPDFTPSAEPQFYTDFPLCFTAGTKISTPSGDRRVEALKVGDLVATADNGLQPIRWIGRRKISRDELTSKPHLAPILLRKDCLAHGVPNADLLVSPQHKVLVASAALKLNFGLNEALAPAKSLVNGHSVKSAGPSAPVEYIHLMFDQHEIVNSNGMWSESFYPGDMALNGLDQDTRKEFFELFPDAPNNFVPLAKPALTAKEARLVAP